MERTGFESNGSAVRKEYLPAPPAIFLNRNGNVDKRQPRNVVTSDLQNFMSQEQPCCVYEFPDVKTAESESSAAYSYVKRYHLGIQIVRRKNKVLLVKTSGEKKEKDAWGQTTTL